MLQNLTTIHTSHLFITLNWLHQTGRIRENHLFRMNIDGPDLAPCCCWLPAPPDVAELFKHRGRNSPKTHQIRGRKSNLVARNGNSLIPNFRFADCVSGPNFAPSLFGHDDIRFPGRNSLYWDHHHRKLGTTTICLLLASKNRYAVLYSVWDGNKSTPVA